MANTMNDVLRSIYYNVQHTAGFSSKRKLFEAARDRLPDLTLEQVEEWLRGETVYTLHRPARNRFARNMTIAHAEGEWCQADLADMQGYADANDGHRFLITFIDVFTKKATAVPIKSKNMNDVAAGLDSILSEFRCRNLLTDRGLEFNNAKVKELMDKYDIRLCFAHNEQIKAAVVERFNRTLKTRMHKYFTSKGTRRYVNVLDALISSYNRTVHSSTGMRPIDVDSSNTDVVFRRLYGASSQRALNLKKPVDVRNLKVGDNVRIRYILTPMQKSYFPMFSDQVYTISAVVPEYPFHMYRVKNWAGNVMNRKYYAHDLQLVSKDVRHRVERVLKRRGNRALVKWIGYPNEANSWIRWSQLSNV